METTVLSLQSLYEKLRMQVDLLNENVEPSEYFMILGFIFNTYHLRQMPEVPIQMPATFLLYACASCFPDFIQMAQNFDDCRRKWLRTEQELGSCKEALTKTETERGALEVKLKHARNQVDVEIRRRQKAEADCEKLVWWIKCRPLFVDVLILSPFISPGSRSFSFVLCLHFYNAGPSNSVDPGPPDQ